VESVEVITEEEVRRRHFRGSPTIRVDGVDVDADDSEDEPFGLTCRVYRRADGQISPLPDPDRIRAALRAAIEGKTGE
jgi:hypothetical protein